MTKTTVVVNTASGLHARPANFFIKKASEFKSTIKVLKGEKEADGKRLLSVLTLGVKQGESIIITADGEDENKAIEALKNAVESDFEG